MSKQSWTPTIGLRNATLSLTWRAAVVAVVWFGLLWSFHAVLGAIGLTFVPLLIALGFAVLAGTVAGFVIARGLDETAGFVSPLLTLLAIAFAAIAIVGTEAVYDRTFVTSVHSLRFIVVGVAMVVASAWIVKWTLIES